MAILESFLQHITNVKFPHNWPYFGVWVKAVPTLDHSSSDSQVAIASAVVSLNPGTTNGGLIVNLPVLPTTPTSLAIPDYPLSPGGTGEYANAGQMFQGFNGFYANATLEQQGAGLVRLPRGVAQSGSITVTPIYALNNWPRTISVSIGFYIMRLVKGTTLSFTQGDTAINLPVTTVLGTLAYTLDVTGGGTVPASPRTDTFSFTAP